MPGKLVQASEAVVAVRSGLFGKPEERSAARQNDVLLN
jgi:hypothetical protein